jgi:hypothetical protein
VIPWTEVERHLHGGEGTLIVEQTNKLGCHFWWTEDDIAACAPMPVPIVEAMDHHTGKSSDSFVLWCFREYLSPTKGKAHLTLPEKLDLSGFIETEYLLSHYPKAKIVQTVLLRTPPAKRTEELR